MLAINTKIFDLLARAGSHAQLQKAIALTECFSVAFRTNLLYSSFANLQLSIFTALSNIITVIVE
jgi:hypothetical protein